jgi:hypothetical protein
MDEFEVIDVITLVLFFKEFTKLKDKQIIIL